MVNFIHKATNIVEILVKRSFDSLLFTKSHFFFSKLNFQKTNIAH